MTDAQAERTAVFETLWNIAEAEEAKRATDMPTETDALKVMFQAWQRLKELGWREAIYCPKDGSHFDAVEVGSTGIHETCYEGEWPTGRWWCFDSGDVYPMRPCLYRPTEDERARWAKFRELVADLRPTQNEDTAS